MLIAFVLHHHGVLQRPLLYLSLYFKQHRDEYYRLLDQVRTEGDWEAWLDFFLEGIEQTAQNAVETDQRLVNLIQEDTRKIRRAGRRANTALRVFDAMCQRPLMTIAEVQHRTNLSFPGATNGMNTLMSLGIVRETTGKKHNRIFAYNRYLAILGEGTENTLRQRWLQPFREG